MKERLDVNCNIVQPRLTKQEEMERTAMAGRFSRTIVLTKKQEQSLEKLGISVTPLKSKGKNHFVYFCNWLSPVEGTFAEELYQLALENCTSSIYEDYSSVISTIRRIANMTSLSTTLAVAESSILQNLAKDGFSYKVIKEVPLTLHVDWHSPETRAETVAGECRKEALLLIR